MEIITIARDQPGYPITLRTCFPGLDYIGDIELLNTATLLTIFSSTKCPASAILKAHDYAKEIRDGETEIISGFHSSAEREVFEVPMKGSCPIMVTIIVILFYIRQCIMRED